MNFVANIPYTKCWVRKEYLHDLKRGHGELVEAIMFAVKSVQGRALMFEAYLPEYGACFDKFPLSAFVWKENIKEEDQLPLGTIELWDSFSSNIQIWTKSLLKASDVEIMLKGGGRRKGEYMFTMEIQTQLIQEFRKCQANTNNTILANSEMDNSLLNQIIECFGLKHH